MDNACKLIPVPFKIPVGYRRVFVFEAGGFQERIEVDWEGIHVEERGGSALGGREASLCLDWIAEAITTVRLELGVPT